MDEWLPLSPLSHGDRKGAEWFLNIRVSLRFAVMRLDESQIHSHDVHLDDDEHLTAQTFVALADGDALDFL